MAVASSVNHFDDMQIAMGPARYTAHIVWNKYRPPTQQATVFTDRGEGKRSIVQI